VNLLRFRFTAAVCTVASLFVPIAPAQKQGDDKVDLGTLTQIKNEA